MTKALQILHYLFFALILATGLFLASAHSVFAVCPPGSQGSPGNCVSSCGLYYKQGVSQQGVTWDNVSCSCPSGETNLPAAGSPRETDVCCGYLDGQICRAAQPPFAAGQPITNAQLDQLNPLIQNGDPALAAMLSTPAGVVNRVVVFAFPIAGLILFVMIVWGGFEMLSGATTKKSIDTGKQRITAAFIGFLLLFLAYWIVVIIEAVFGVKIL